MSRDDLTPLPADYHRSIHEVELRHWWHRGMLETTALLLRDRLALRDQTLLDAGCGTGGFLAWAASSGAFAGLHGFDPSAEAVALARERVPAAHVVVGEAVAIALPDATVDVVACNDVLQHVHEQELARSVRELARVLRPGGVLVVRTNGARRASAPLPDWRLFDVAGLTTLLEGAGLEVERITHANALLSVWGAARGRAPRPPDASRHGVPALPGRVATAVGGATLRLERAYLRPAGRSLPYGHTILARAVRQPAPA